MAKGHGGARAGAGRKPKSDEIAKIEMMDSVADPRGAWERLWKLCEQNDVTAIRTWIEHRYGKPRQSVDNTHEGAPVVILRENALEHGVKGDDSIQQD